MKLLQLLIPFILPIGLLATDTLLPKTKSFCNTAIGRKSIKVVPTLQKSTTNIVKVTEYLTTTPLVIINPVPATLTSTIVEHSTITESLNQVTDTFFLTSTVTVPTTVELPTITSSVTETTTSTTYIDSTWIVPTASNWLPAVSTIPNGTPSKRSLKLRGNSNDRNDRGNDRDDDDDDDVKSLSCSKPKPIFPKSVTCYVIVQAYKVIVVTKTARKTSTITLPQATSTGYFTTTSLTTLSLPNASTTSTIVITEFSTIFFTPAPFTTTSTATVTATVENPVATSYAACAPEYMVSKIEGKFIGSFTVLTNIGGHFSFEGPSGKVTIEKCCSSCMANPLCGSWLGETTGFCYNMITQTDVCVNPGTYRHQAQGQAGISKGYTVGSGNCAAVVQG